MLDVLPTHRENVGEDVGVVECGLYAIVYHKMSGWRDHICSICKQFEKRLHKLYEDGSFPGLWSPLDLKGQASPLGGPHWWVTGEYMCRRNVRTPVYIRWIVSFRLQWCYWTTTSFEELKLCVCVCASCRGAEKFASELYTRVYIGTYSRKLYSERVLHAELERLRRTQVCSAVFKHMFYEP